MYFNLSKSEFGDDISTFGGNSTFEIGAFDINDKPRNLSIHRDSVLHIKKDGSTYTGELDGSEDVTIFLPFYPEDELTGMKQKFRLANTANLSVSSLPSYFHRAYCGHVDCYLPESRSEAVLRISSSRNLAALRDVSDWDHTTAHYIEKLQRANVLHYGDMGDRFTTSKMPPCGSFKELYPHLSSYFDDLPPDVFRGNYMRGRNCHSPLVDVSESKVLKDVECSVVNSGTGCAGSVQGCTTTEVVSQSRLATAEPPTGVFSKLVVDDARPLARLVPPLSQKFEVDETLPVVVAPPNVRVGDVISQKSSRMKLLVDGKGDRKYIVPIKKSKKKRLSLLWFMAIVAVVSGFHICGDDKHGNLWEFPLTGDCKAPAFNGKERKFTVFVDKPSMNLTAFACRRVTTKVVTSMSIFFSKQVISRTIAYDHVTPLECNNLRYMYENNKTDTCDGSWCGPRVKKELKYSYFTTNYINVFTETQYRPLVIRQHKVGDNVVLMSNEADMSLCHLADNTCVTRYATLLWRGGNDQCSLERVSTSRYIELYNGDWLSSDAQISFTLGEQVKTCEGLLYRTKQGIYVSEWAGVMRNLRSTDVDAAEKNFVMDALSMKIAKFMNDTNRIMCKESQIIKNIIMSSQSQNPTAIMRSYFGRDDISAKFVGDVVQVWSCSHVIIRTAYYSHKVQDTCYDLLPVDFEWGNSLRRGFVVPLTNEVILASATHPCGATEYYYHNVNGSLWAYRSDGSRVKAADVRKLPAYTVYDTSNDHVFVDNIVHSVYGPSGSRYRMEMLSELGNMVGHILHVEEQDDYSNPQYMEKVGRVYNAALNSASDTVKVLFFSLVVKAVMVLAVVVIVAVIFRRMSHFISINTANDGGDRQSRFREVLSKVSLSRIRAGVGVSVPESMC